jgi:single-strand DNA-binding protein
VNETYVTISGNVVADPTRRLTRQNVPFVTFRVASTARRMDSRTGGYVEAGTNFVNVTAFRGLAINLANSIKKGDPVIVYGRMRVNQWDNGEQKGVSVEVDAYNVGFDMARGTSTFTKVVRPGLHAVDDRLGDPAVQAAAREQDTAGRADEPDAWAGLSTGAAGGGEAAGATGATVAGTGPGDTVDDGDGEQAPADDGGDGRLPDDDDTEESVDEPALRAG